MGKSIFEEKRKLFDEWTKLKKLGDNEKLNFKQFYKIRQKEKVSYEKWRFLDNFTKAKEKIENEKKKN